MKWKIAVPLLIAAALAAAFCFGDRTPKQTSSAETPSAPVSAATPTELAEPSPAQPTSENSRSQTPATAAPSPSEKPQEIKRPDEKQMVTISISCADILANQELLNPGKAGLVPADGWLLPPTEVTFSEGESVFDLLQRTCAEKNIHLEFENTPMYNSAYIEGIGNLYEFDCGELSGWRYQVNGWSPNYGCSQYILTNGDKVEWEYICTRDEKN